MGEKMNPKDYATSSSRPFLCFFVYAIIFSVFFIVSESSYATSYEDDFTRRLDLSRHDNYQYNALSFASPSQSHLTGKWGSRVYHVVGYGADPTGDSDSTEAIERAIREAFGHPTDGGDLMKGILDLGGSQLHLDGGTYKISRPLRLPDIPAGNFMIHGGSLRASDTFPRDGHLIELKASKSIMYEYITLKDLMLNCNFRGGGIAITNSLRTTVHNCYVSHFTTQGIAIQGGHESYITNCFLGQHINAGGDPGERQFSGTGVKVMGNDNVLKDVVIYSAEIGVLVSGQANLLTGVHCYNKATGLGGVGIYVAAPGFTQTRIVNCYLDFTGLVLEDPVQVVVKGCFFLGNGAVVLKSLHGVMSGVNIVDNMFSGDYTGVHIVELDESNAPFARVDQVVVERNNVRGMVLKSTVGTASTYAPNATTWTVDFSTLLLFPNLIKNILYSLEIVESSLSQGQLVFPSHVITNRTHNRVTVQSNVAVSATLYVQVHQT